MPDGVDHLGGAWFDIKELLARRDGELKELLARRDLEHRERSERVERQLQHIETLLASKADALALGDLRVLAERNATRLGELEEAMTVFVAGRKAVYALWSLGLVFVGTLTALIVLVLDRL